MTVLCYRVSYVSLRSYVKNRGGGRVKNFRDRQLPIMLHRLLFKPTPAPTGVGLNSANRTLHSFQRFRRELKGNTVSHTWE